MYDQVHDYANGYLGEWIRSFFDPDCLGYAIDVGASDGFSINSTFHLEKAHKWTVVSVEANPNYAKLLKKNRSRVEMCACAAEPKDEAIFHINKENPEAYSALKIANHPAVTGWNKKDPWEIVKVPVRTVDQIVRKWDFPRLDVLCVDVEGGELEVLKGSNLAHWKPKVVVSEAWEHGQEYPYLAQFGYKLKARSVHNDCYVLETE
jgi:FkbM family methyltransferase